VEEHGAHRVPHGHALLAHRQVVLRVAGIEGRWMNQVQVFLKRAQLHGLPLTPQNGAARGQAVVLALEDRRLLSPLVQVKLRQAQITLVPGCPVETDPGEFDSFVTRKPVALSWTKRPVKAIGQSRSNVEQRSLSCGLVVRHSSLKKVARAE